ncbi:MAG: DJ-1/PfpI family protein [Planctomycetes bacterium]|nr:DJ-1/PfpI family protein [Planctomycetota bacterium]
MPRVCVLLAQGFEEIEAITIIDVLRRAEVDVVTLGVKGSGPGGLEVAGAHGVAVRADRTLAAGAAEAWDAVILPGGMPGSTNLRDSPEVQGLIKKQAQAGRRLAAICAAPIALGAAGVLQGKRATSYPGFEKELRGATCVQDRVVRDGNVMTSRGPGTAMEFALELVSELKSKDAAKALRAGMLVGAA